MRAVHIGIGHYYYLLISQIVNVEPRAKARAKSLGQIGYFLIAPQLGGCGAQHVQYLSSQRKQCLRATIASHFGGAARAVPLHYKQFGAFSSI